METFHASPQRTSNKEIAIEANFIKKQLDVTALLDALPYFVMILDDNRQVVFLNESMRSFLKTDTKKLLGKRPGELINCIYSNEMKAGCGTFKNCRFCGAVNSIIESQATGNSVTKDCRIISTKADVWTNFEFSVTSSKLLIQQKVFTLFTLVDISDKKRRLALERVFFHDIINSAGSISGILELLHHNEKKENFKNLLEVAKSASHELVEEIIAQRQLLDAENNQLVANFKPCNSLSIIKNVASRMSHHNISKNRIVSIDKNSKDIEFISDHKILKRILVNMVKNALEAIPDGEEVLMRTELKNNRVVFSIHNPGFIPEDIQLQIFHRTFSTKGENRGLGTYSMKMHTEKYLNGKIYFKSSKIKGTTFFCELPFVKG